MVYYNNKLYEYYQTFDCNRTLYFMADFKTLNSICSKLRCAFCMLGCVHVLIVKHENSSNQRIVQYSYKY